MHLPSMIHLSGQRIFLPFYHSVRSEEALPHLQHLYPVRDIETFQKDLDYLLDHFKPITLQSLKEITIKGLKPEENYMHLSFDDGLREVHELVLPILEEKGIPASIFVNSAFVDNKALFFRFKISLLIERVQQDLPSETQQKLLIDILGHRMTTAFTAKTFADIILDLTYTDIELIDKMATTLGLDFAAFLEKQRPYMTSNQIRDAIHRGFTIGGHSVDHPIYKNLTLDEQLDQTEGSIRFLQENFKIPDKIFSFPFTDDGVERTFFEIIEADAIAELTFGCAGLKQEDFPFHLQRFPMETTMHDANKLVNTEYFYY